MGAISVPGQGLPGWHFLGADGDSILDGRQLAAEPPTIQQTMVGLAADRLVQ